MELIDKLNNLLPKYKAILPFSKKEVDKKKFSDLLTKTYLKVLLQINLFF